MNGIVPELVLIRSVWWAYCCTELVTWCCSCLNCCLPTAWLGLYTVTVHGSSSKFKLMVPQTCQCYRQANPSPNHGPEASKAPSSPKSDALQHSIHYPKLLVDNRGSSCAAAWHLCTHVPCSASMTGSKSLELPVTASVHFRRSMTDHLDVSTWVHANPASIGTVCS